MAELAVVREGRAVPFAKRPANERNLRSFAAGWPFVCSLSIQTKRPQGMPLRFAFDFGYQRLSPFHGCRVLASYVPRLGAPQPTNTTSAWPFSAANLVAIVPMLARDFPKACRATKAADFWDSIEENMVAVRASVVVAFLENFIIVSGWLLESILEGAGLLWFLLVVLASRARHRVFCWL